MSSNRCLPSGDQSAGSIFNTCRGGDHYSHFEDDEILDHTPPPLDFPTPIKFEPRRSKFHCLQEKEAGKGVGDQMQSGEWAPPKVILKTPCKTGGEKLKQQLLMLADSRRASFDGSSPHGSIEAHPSSVETVQLFQKAQVDVNKLMPKPRMLRRHSDTSLFQTVTDALQLRGGKSLVKPSINTSVDSTSAGSKCDHVDKNTVTNEHMPDEVNLPNVSVTSKFSGWLFGGNKKIDVEDKDINVFSPTSY